MQKKHILRAAAMSLALILLLTSSGAALTLRYPQKGENVAELQRALKQLGYYTKTIDGSYGSGTKSAVRAFQKAQGLSVDGVAGAKTIGRLEALTGIDIDGDSEGSGSTGTITPVTPPADGLFSGVYTALQSGSSGSRVRILQRALAALGFTVSETGSFDAATILAVRAFQQSQGLTVDGKAGKNTLKKLESFFDEAGNLISGPIVTEPPKDEEEEAPEEPDESYDVPERTLRYGMTGEDVKYTQQRLYTLKYYSGSRDGKFGADMQSAVKAFQRKHGLTADGVVGPATIKKLFSSSAIYADEDAATPTPTPTPTPKPEATPSRTLRYGSSGDDVKLLQARLIELGYMAGIPSGSFGTTTQSAVKAFQKANSLTADGVAGSKTYKKLFSAAAIPADGEATPTPTPTPPPTPTPTPDGEYVIPTRTLRYGYSGEDVRTLQRRLVELDYLKITPDGSFGTSTLNALKAFQQENSLSVDGVAGSKTYAKLFSDSAKPAPTDTSVIPNRNLTYGDEGDDVKSVQRRLKELGYLSGTADGKYGVSTTAAMKAFQEMNSLTATGNGNTATYVRLYSDDAIAANGFIKDEDAAGYITLRSGATGTLVIRLQQTLKKYDYDVQVTGTYDDQTIQAVRSFQALNGLSVDGVAGKNTQSKLYSGNVKSFPVGPTGAVYGSMGYVAAPAKSQIKLLHWANELKNALSYGDALLAYDPETGISWSLTIIARGRHCDVEPSTKADTAAMMAAFGNKVYWTPVKPVYIRLPDGRWTVATTHNVAHGVNPIPNNDFEGQNCVHFWRDMSETEQKDPDYGVTNQKALREFWFSLTGETIPYR